MSYLLPTNTASGSYQIQLEWSPSGRDSLPIDMVNGSNWTQMAWSPSNRDRGPRVCTPVWLSQCWSPFVPPFFSSAKCYRWLMPWEGVQGNSHRKALSSWWEIPTVLFRGWTATDSWDTIPVSQGLTEIHAIPSELPKTVTEKSRFSYLPQEKPNS